MPFVDLTLHHAAPSPTALEAAAPGYDGLSQAERARAAAQVA